MGGEQVMLFDLSQDPTERKNVALLNPGVVASMQTRLKVCSGAVLVDYRY
jgi:hypothetical protein